ncbi:hypothetical protein ACIRRA_36700 [Nocardia sp. NPDC101769]|uniref:hypothetical protein n=1 Tax=Nocardia sp. NPDC101769 TaxID=3364333 RepID=UPI003829E1EF
MRGIDQRGTEAEILMEAAESDRPPGESEREELERLRRELAAHRGVPGTGDRPGGRAGREHRGALRWTAMVVLLALVAVLAVGSVLARFAHGEVLDTGRYLRIVTPLGTDPALQSELVDRITDAIMDRVDVEALTAQALTAITENDPRVPAAVVGLAPLVGKQARDFVRDTATSVLASNEFEALWIQANRQTHKGVVAVLTGDTHPAVGMSEDGTVSVSLGPIIDRVRTVLTEQGFTFVEKVPAIDRSLVVFRSPELVKARWWVSFLDRTDRVLPWITVLLAACAVWVAPKGARRQAISWMGVALALAMAALAVAIGIARSAYLHAVPAEVMTPQAAATVIDAFLVPLRTAVRAVFTVAVVIALAGFLSGPSRSAVAVRDGYNRALAAVRSRRSGREPQAIESAMGRFRGPLRGGIIAVAVIVLAFWRYPTGLVLIGTVLVTVTALLAVELVAGPRTVRRDRAPR